MNDPINILDQQFYSFNIDEIVKECSSEKRCTLIIDENNLAEFLAQCKEFVGKSVNQIIVISENLNTVSNHFEGINVLLISAKSIEEAVKFSIYGASLSSNVVYVSDKGENELQRVLKLIEH